MVTKFKLNPSPTFKASVLIPQPGEVAPVPLEFTFKHRTRDELQEFLKAATDMTDTEATLKMAEGWELSDPLNAESLETLQQNHIGVQQLIFDAYIRELTKARAKN